MSWQGWAWMGLGLVVVGGLAWYERSRPPARTVALVAALAALAVAGRLAFAAIPNVVATTDIVLITGYSVGAAPGFAVGALAALISNLWLGQGPWTPWEMAGWGLVGLGGAALATLTRRRLGRIGLAAACGLAGLAYGALLDYSVMVSYGGAQTLDRYLAISARGVPFNVAHAAGNVVLALAAGPALVRMISRYRSRLEFDWRAAGTAALALAVILTAVVPQTARAGRSASAVRWLERAQGRDGGFGIAPGSRSSPAMSGWAALGLESAGANPLDVRSGGPSALAYLRAHAASLRSTGDLERTVLALAGAGVDPRRFAGRDLVAELRSRRSGGGSFGGEVNLTAFGVLALRAAGASRSSLHRSAAWLRGAQNGDGGWGFRRAAASDPDSTGAALQGLAATGVGGMRRGTAYLRRVQRGDGGFPLGGSGPSNTQSTAWAVQGLIAAGADPDRVRAHGRSGLDYLAHRQASDGHFRYSSSSDQTPVWGTAQALLAVNRRALPLAPVPRSRRGARPSRSGAAAGPGQGGTARGQVAPGKLRGGPARHRPRAAQKGAAGRGDPASAAKRASRGWHRRAARQPFRSLAAPAGPSARGGGRDDATAWVAGSFAALGAVLVAGFFWYRRRLP